MVLKDFNYLTDENIHPELVKFLRDKSLNIIDVKEEKLIGTSDLNLMSLAFKENRIVITQDRDFGKLIYTKNTDFIGIIYLRPGHILPKFHIQTFDKIMKSNFEYEIPFILVAENSGASVKFRLRNKIRV